MNPKQNKHLVFWLFSLSQISRLSILKYCHSQYDSGKFCTAYKSSTVAIKNLYQTITAGLNNLARNDLHLAKNTTSQFLGFIFGRLTFIIVTVFLFHTGISANNSADSIAFYIKTPINNTQELEQLWAFISTHAMEGDFQSKRVDSLIRKVKTNSVRLNHIKLIIESSLESTKYPFENSRSVIAAINELNWLMLRYKSNLSWKDHLVLYHRFTMIFWSLRKKNEISKQQAVDYAKKACALEAKHLGKESFASISLLFRVLRDLNYDSTLYYLKHYQNPQFDFPLEQIYLNRALLERQYKNWEAERFYMDCYEEQMAANKRPPNYHEIAVTLRNIGRLDEAERLLLRIRGSFSNDIFKSLLIPDINLGKLYIEKRNWQEAEFYLLEAKQLATTISNFHLDETYDLLRELYSKSGQLEKLNVILLEYQDIITERENQLLEEFSSQDAFHQYLDELSASLEQSRQAEKNTKTFFGIILLGTFFVVVLLIFSFVAFNRRKAAKLQQQLNHLRLRSIANQFNSHLTFNSLSGIQYLLFEQKYDTALQAIEDFGIYMRQQMKSIRAGVLPLANEIQLIRRYLAIEQLRFEQPLDVYFSCPAEYNQWFVPTGIIQPMVENILQHAFPNGMHDAQIRIVVFKKNNQLSLSIEDNGVGISTDSLNFKGESSSLGLRIIHEKIKTYNKLTKKKFAIQILSKHTHPAFDGTKIMLIFPSLTDKDVEVLTLNA